MNEKNRNPPKISLQSMLIDPGGTIQSLYRTTGVPESIIIDKSGIIIDKIIGQRDWGSSEAIQYFRDLIQKN